jgi:hypothetical protein
MPNNRNLSLLAVAISTPGLMAANSPSTTPVTATDQLHSLSTTVEADARANLKAQILTIDPMEKVGAVGAKVLLTRMAATTPPFAGTGTAISPGSVGRTNTDIPECQAISADWPVTITGSSGYNGSHCLALKFGSAVLDGEYSGGFQVIGRTLLVYLDTTGSNGDPATLLFSAQAAKDKIGKGAFEYIQGGTSYDDGSAAFGTKNGC